LICFAPARGNLGVYSASRFASLFVVLF
jgi:hypothetical protein